jgi:hypothetical protein
MSSVIARSSLLKAVSTRIAIGMESVRCPSSASPRRTFAPRQPTAAPPDTLGDDRNSASGEIVVTRIGRTFLKAGER